MSEEDVKPSDGGKKPYEKPQVKSREPLESVASVCGGKSGMGECGIPISMQS